MKRPIPIGRADDKYGKAKTALRFALYGLLACTLSFPLSFVAGFFGVEGFAWFVARLSQLSIVAISGMSIGFAGWSIVKMEEKTWLACVSALLAFVELWFGAMMLAHGISHRPL